MSHDAADIAGSRCYRCPGDLITVRLFTSRFLPKFSTLDSLRPNFGYWVKQPVRWCIWLRSTPVVASGQGDKTNETVTPSRDWMSIYGDGITVDGKSLSSGSRIAAVADEQLTW